jgi:hypothetical protein
MSIKIYLQHLFTPRPHTGHHGIMHYVQLNGITDLHPLNTIPATTSLIFNKGNYIVWGTKSLFA